jgi:predicted DCC family thiol-disulfide oxidoreductase YuxK
MKSEIETTKKREEQATVYIDRECGMCVRFAEFVTKRDPRHRFTFEDARDRCGAGSVCPDAIELRTNGSTFSGSDATLRIVGGLRFPWSLLGALLVLPRAVREPIYRWIAHRRRKFWPRNP